jgi:hypothetical protein
VLFSHATACACAASARSNYCRVDAGQPPHNLSPCLGCGSLRRRNDRLHLVRVPALRPARVDGCHHVVIRLSGLNRTVDEGRARVCRSHGGVGATGHSRPVHVVSHDIRTRTRIPGKINAVLYRAYSTPAKCILCDFPIAQAFPKRCRL